MLCKKICWSKLEQESPFHGHPLIHVLWLNLTGAMCGHGCQPMHHRIVQIPYPGRGWHQIISHWTISRSSDMLIWNPARFWTIVLMPLFQSFTDKTLKLRTVILSSRIMHPACNGPDVCRPTCVKEEAEIVEKNPLNCICFKICPIFLPEFPLWPQYLATSKVDASP